MQNGIIQKKEVSYVPRKKIITVTCLTQRAFSTASVISAAHVMAQAVMEMFPEAKIAIGPPVEAGFYYDFDLPRPLTPEDSGED